MDLFDENWRRTCQTQEDIEIGVSASTLESDLSNYQALDQGKKIILKKVYPIPAHDQLTIEISSLEATKINAQVFDARGVLVNTKSLSLNSGDNQIGWDISNLPSGFYQVLFQSGTRHAPIRFMKQGL